jgi:hypothetical protein
MSLNYRIDASAYKVMHNKKVEAGLIPAFFYVEFRRWVFSRGHFDLGVYERTFA